MGDGVENIKGKIHSFQRKYYLNILIKGTIFTLSAVLVYFLIAALLEHNLWMAPWARLAIFSTFFVILFYCLYRFLKAPIIWWVAKQGIDEEESARIIGDHFPTVRDRLLNLIQLSNVRRSSSLAVASIRQKAIELEPLRFDTVVDLGNNRRFLKYLAVPAGIFLLIFLINQQIITQSTQRIIHFNQEFSPQAPFSFIVANKSLVAFYNEDFNLNVRLEGQAIPQDVYMTLNDQRFKLEADGKNSFSYLFDNVQDPFSFQLEAAGFFSPLYQVEVISRPELTGFKVGLEFPKYLQRKNETLLNAGNLEVPEGTVIHWNLATAHATAASIYFFTEKSSFNFQIVDNQSFTYSKKFLDPEGYEIFLENDKSKNKEKITYRIDVIKDQHPNISVNSYKDSVLYKRLILGGVIGDDYGVTELSLHFSVKDEQNQGVVNKSVTIPILRNQIQQSFIYNWSVDSLNLKPGYQLEYYLKVWDNDGVNGRKATRSATYSFFVPTEDKLVADIDRSRSQTEQKIDQSVGNANKLQEQIEQAYQRLKGKQSLDWQDKKMLQDIVEKKQNLDQLIEEMKKQNKLLEDKKSSFTEQEERIKEKAEQLQKLMNELLDEETRKLFEELQKLMNENTDVSQIQKILDKLNQNSENLEKELERTLELFKQLQYDFKLDQVVKQLEKQVEEQKSLMEKTDKLAESKDKGEKKNRDSKNEKSNKGKEENSNPNDDGKEESENEQLAKEQEEIKKDFEKTSEQIDELKKLGDDLNQPDDQLPEESETDEVQQQQEQSQQMLEQNQPQKSKQNQQKALEQMQQMQQKMQEMQNSMSQEMDMQNLESLRQIIHGLIKLSFDQESLIKSFQDLQQSDPRFNALAQQQLKLKDDSKVLEDSLISLAKRDPFMGSFITKEISELNSHLDKAIEANRERRKPQAQSEMQLSMTSINNLALMLDSHMDMMMQMMANAKPGKSSKKQKQKGNKSLSELQQQLNSRIQELKKSGKGGRELSEELAEMAAEQERIRRALQEMEEKMKKEGQMPGGELPSKMEQTETELVNKQLTDQLVKRQQEILTRLLEAEKSMREQDMDDERKGETAKDYEKEIPKAFEEYLRLKEKEVELLKTVPPKLFPYYKKEVNEYFKRMGNE